MPAHRSKRTRRHTFQSGRTRSRRPLLEHLENRQLLAVNVLDSMTYQGHDYLLVTAPDPEFLSYPTPSDLFTWNAAESHAQKLGSHLATIEDSDENEALSATLGEWGDMWIGLSDAAEEGQFVWSSGSDSPYRNWDVGEPQDPSGDRDYVKLTNWGAEPGKWLAVSESGPVPPRARGLIEIASSDVSIELEAGTYVIRSSDGPFEASVVISGPFPDSQALSYTPVYYRASRDFLTSMTLFGSEEDDVVETTNSAYSGFAQGGTPRVKFYGGLGDDVFHANPGTAESFFNFYDGGDGVDTVVAYETEDTMDSYGERLEYGSFVTPDGTEYTGWRIVSHPSDWVHNTTHLTNVEIVNLLPLSGPDGFYGLIDPSMDESLIASIIDVVPDGGNLFFAPGTYTTPIEIVGKNLRLVGAAGIWSGPPSEFEEHRVVFDLSEQIDPTVPAIAWSAEGRSDGRFMLQGGFVIQNAPGDAITVEGAHEVVLRDLLIDSAGRLGSAMEPQYAGIHLVDVTQATVFDATIRHTGLSFGPSYSDPDSFFYGFHNHGVGLLAVATGAKTEQSVLNLAVHFEANGFAGVAVDTPPGHPGSTRVNLGWRMNDPLWLAGTESFEYFSAFSGFTSPERNDSYHTAEQLGLGSIGVYLPGSNDVLNEDVQPFAATLFGAGLRYPLIMANAQDEVALSYNLIGKLVDALPGTSGAVLPAAAVGYFEDSSFALGRLQQEVRNGGVLNEAGYVIDLTNGDTYLSSGELLLDWNPDSDSAAIEQALLDAAQKTEKGELAVKMTDPTDLDKFLQHLGDVEYDGTETVTINVNLEPAEDEIYGGLEAEAPDNTLLDIDLGGNTVGPGSPALTVVRGQVRVSNGTLSQTLTTGVDESDFPTVLIEAGGHLTLSGVTILEADGHDQSAVRIEDGGTLTVDPTTINRIRVVGPGQLISHESPATLDLSAAYATGALVFEAFDADTATTVTDHFAIEDLILHAMDTVPPGPLDRGIVTWQAGSLFVTPKTGGLQHAAELATTETLIWVSGEFGNEHIHTLHDTGPLPPSVQLVGGPNYDHFRLDLRDVTLSSGLQLGSALRPWSDVTLYGEFDVADGRRLAVEATGTIAFEVADATMQEAPVSGVSMIARSGLITGPLLTLLTPAAGGTVTIDAFGQWSYSPQLGFYGTDQFVLTAQHVGAAVVREVVTITVEQGVTNRPPVISSPDYVEVEENTVGVLAVTAIDPDAEQTVEFSISGQGPDDPFFSMSSSGELTFRLSPDFETPLDADEDNIYEVEVVADDGDGGVSTRSISVKILNRASITGSVFVDIDGNGLLDGNELGIDGVVIRLLDAGGSPVVDEHGLAIEAVTTHDGIYLFEDLVPGEYQLAQLQPTGVLDGPEVLGTAGGTIIGNDVMQLSLERIDASDYVFTEIGDRLSSGDSASISFWQNKHGQSLIKSGGAALANWLTSNFANIFGDTFANAGSNAGTVVARFYKEQLFKQKSMKSAGPAKVDTQFMATALSTFFTSSQLAGTVATRYGFRVSDTGIGTKIVNVGSSGSAFGVADGTDVTIMQLLLATNAITDRLDRVRGAVSIYDLDGNGRISCEESALRAKANRVYSLINEAGRL